LNLKTTDGDGRTMVLMGNEDFRVILDIRMKSAKSFVIVIDIYTLHCMLIFRVCGL